MLIVRNLVLFDAWNKINQSWSIFSDCSIVWMFKEFLSLFSTQHKPYSNDYLRKLIHLHFSFLFLRTTNTDENFSRILFKKTQILLHHCLEILKESWKNIHIYININIYFFIIFFLFPEHKTTLSFYVFQVLPVCILTIIIILSQFFL